jgi:Tfp pilus assembly protein PilF
MMLSRTSKTTTHWAAGVLCVLAVSACGSSSKGGSTTKPDRKKTVTLLNKALQQLVAGKTTQAQTDFEEVIRLDPSNKFAYYNLGLIDQTAGKRAAAESQYRLVLTIDNKYAPALYNFGILRAQASATADAIDLYRRAIASLPTSADAHFNLGLLLRTTGKTAEGNAEIQAAVKLEPALAGKTQAQGIPLTGK